MGGKGTSFWEILVINARGYLAERLHWQSGVFAQRGYARCIYPHYVLQQRYI